jgi:BON domain-containing protein
VVLLSGTVDNPTTSRLAEQCAAGNPNVRAVINSLRVRSGSPTLPDAPFLQPAIGTEVFFLDGVSGWVQQVIVDPDNRRVTAMTLQGRPADQGQDLRPKESAGSHRLEGMLLIPLNTVRYLTKSSGFLNIRSDEHEQYSAADPAGFVTPEKNWMPPYPYCSNDVLFQAGPTAAATAILWQEGSPIEVTSAHQLLKDQMLENDSLGG